MKSSRQNLFSRSIVIKMESLGQKVCTIYFFLRDFLEFSNDEFVKIPPARGFSKSQGDYEDYEGVFKLK